MSGRQTWLGSIVEMKANIAIGFAINYCVNLLVLPLMWQPGSPFASAFWIGCVFTVVSVARQLIIRRRFNAMQWGHAPEAPPVGGINRDPLPYWRNHGDDR